MNPVDIPPSKQSVTSSPVILWGPVLLAFFSLITLGWLDNARGPLYPLILEGLSISHVQGGLFFAVASLVSVFANFLVPIFLKRISSVSALLFGLACMMCFILGLSQASNYAILIVSAVFFGMALGTVMVTINIVIEESVPLVNQRSFLSAMHSLYGLSAFLAPIFIGYILAWPTHWSKAFLPVLFVGVPLFLYGMWQKTKINFVKPIAEVNFKQLLRKDSKSTYLRSVVMFWSLILACYVSSELYFSTRITVLYQEGFGLSLETSRHFLSVFFLGLFAGRLINSAMPSWIKGRNVILTSLLFSLFWLVFCIYMQPTWIWFMGFLMAPVYPVAVSEIARQSRGEFKVISALAIAMSSFVVVVMHVLAGIIADLWGLHASMYIPVVFLALALVVLFSLWPKEEPPR